MDEEVLQMQDDNCLRMDGRGRCVMDRLDCPFKEGQRKECRDYMEGFNDG